MDQHSSSRGPCGVIIGDYRGIDRLELPIRPLTLIVGRNNVGKSNVLQALGHDPFAPGEEERATDPRPQLSWAHEADLSDSEAQHWLEDELKNVGVEPALARPFARRLLKMTPLVTWIEKDAQVIGLSRLGLNRIDLLGYMAESGIARSAWIDELMESTDDGGLFVPIGGSGDERAIPSLPVATTVYADADDVTEHLTQRVRDLLHLCYGTLADGDSVLFEALGAVDEGRMEPLENLGLLQTVLVPLEQEANRLAPDFVTEQGLIGISVHPGADDAKGELRRVLVELRDELHDGTDRAKSLVRAALEASASANSTFDIHLDSSFFEIGDSRTSIRPYSRLGRGTRRWIAASLVEAADRLEAHLRAHSRVGTLEEVNSLLEAFDPVLEQTADSDSRSSNRAARVRLLDEPGESLHPLAQRDVLNWLEARVEEGDTVVFSAHQPAMLRTTVRSDDLVVVGLQRRGGSTQAVYMPGSLIEDLERSAHELGITKAEVLLHARGILLVEGADDEAVLTKLYGRELDRCAILLHAIGGSSARSVIDLLESTLFRLLGTPVWVMFDKTSIESLKLRDTPESEHIAAIVEECSDPQRPQVRALPFEPPDILCGFRSGLVKQQFPKLLDATWPKTVEAWRSSPAGLNFKDWVIRRTRVRGNFSPAIISPLVDACTRGPDDASHWLQETMTILFEQIGERQGVPGC